jgi:hypothetical protein|tara:strand:- start:6599 stop:6943 length:345 start_codon:yes stop_codon:yes gene_type:complete
MSFKHKFPTSVTLIGYVESAKVLSKKSTTGLRVRAVLHNPSEQYRMYDLNIPLMAFGTPGKILVEVDKSGELVSVIGRLAMVKGPKGTKMEVLVEHVKSLDEEQEHGMDENIGE